MGDPWNNYTFHSYDECMLTTRNCSSGGFCSEGYAYIFSSAPNISQCQCDGYYTLQSWCSENWFYHWGGSDRALYILGLIFHSILFLLVVCESYPHLLACRENWEKKKPRRWIFFQLFFLEITNGARLFYFAMWASSSNTPTNAVVDKNHTPLTYANAVSAVAFFVSVVFTYLIWIDLATSILNLSNKSTKKTKCVYFFLIFLALVAVITMICLGAIPLTRLGVSYHIRSHIATIFFGSCFLVASTATSILAVFLFREFKKSEKGRKNQYKNYLIWGTTLIFYFILLPFGLAQGFAGRQDPSKFLGFTYMEKFAEGLLLLFAILIVQCYWFGWKLYKADSETSNSYTKFDNE